MIRVPPGWRRAAGAGAVLLVGNQGKIRSRERVGPLRRVAELLDQTLAGAPDWRTLHVGARQRITTQEGEHAFWVPATGELLGAPASRFIGIVYGDDFANVLDAVGAGKAEAIAELSRGLVRDASLGLGVR